jgi:hypothetical protein
MDGLSVVIGAKTWDGFFDNCVPRITDEPDGLAVSSLQGGIQALET